MKNQARMIKSQDGNKLAIVNPNAAGIDIADTEMQVCVPEDRDGENNRRFGSFTQDLNTIVDWLKDCRITTVAMEATGIYYLSLFLKLQDAGIDVLLANPQDVKNLSGRKTDAADAEWLMVLHRYGLLKPCYQPGNVARQIRNLTRQRSNLIRMAEKEVPEVMGRFGAVYGIKGWLKVFSETEDPENLFTYAPWFYRHKGQEWREIKIESYRRHADGFIAKIENVNVREIAQGFTGAEIGILGSSLPSLPEGVYRWRDLIGLKVVNKQDYCLGTVSSLMDIGSNDVLVVKPELNDAYEMKERLIPYVENHILEVNLENKVILVDWDPDF